MKPKKKEKRQRETERFREEVCRDGDKHKVCMGSRCVFHVSGKSTAGCSWVVVYFSLSFLCQPFQHSWKPQNKPKHVPAFLLKSKSKARFLLYLGLFNEGDSRIWTPQCSCCNISVALQENPNPDWWNCGRISKVPERLQKSITHLK